MDMGRPDASPRTLDWNEAPQSQEANEGDWLSTPPPMAGQVPAGNFGQPPMAGVIPSYGNEGYGNQAPVASIIGGDGQSYEVDEDGEEESEYTPGDYGYGKKKNKFLVILIGLVVLLIAAGGFGYWLVKQQANQAVVALKKNILDSVDKKRWDEAITGGSKYRETIKDSGDKEIEFALAWADLQQKLCEFRLPRRRTCDEALERFNSSSAIDVVTQPTIRSTARISPSLPTNWSNEEVKF